MSDHYDVIVVGAGPAGLSAALILGRACRRVLICDRGTPRSWAAKQMHAFVSREGIPPQAFRDIAKGELAALGNVAYRDAEVTDVVRDAGNSFSVVFGDKNESATARKILIATGVFDRLPPIQGLEPLFGKSVFQCPYCDGWEFRGKAVAVYGKGRAGFEMARAMTGWTRDIVWCSDGPTKISPPMRTELHANGIRLIETRIEKLLSMDDGLREIVFVDGKTVAREVLFFDTASKEQSRLAKSLGCEFTKQGKIRCGQYEATSVPGVFAAGNIIQDVQLSIVAAAEGARAAFGINRALTREDFERRASGTLPIEHPAMPDMASE